MEEQAVVRRFRDQQSGPHNYQPFQNALHVYRQTGLYTARQLQKIAKQLNAEKLEWMSARKNGCRVRVGGSALAAGAAATGMFLSGPFIFPAILLGTAVTVGGQVVTSIADRGDKNAQTGFIKRIEQLFKDFENDVKKVEETARDLLGVDSSADVNTLERMLDMLSTDIDFVGVENAPQLTRLRDELGRMRELLDGYSVQNINQMRGFLQQAWHFAAPLLSFEGVFDAGCDHAFFSTCTSEPPRKAHFDCYSKAGKFIYVAGIAANVALFTVSALEANKLDKNLTKMRSAETEEEKIEIMGGIVDSIYNKGKYMEQRIHMIFGQEDFELL